MQWGTNKTLISQQLYAILLLVCQGLTICPNPIIPEFILEIYFYYKKVVLASGGQLN